MGRRMNKGKCLIVILIISLSSFNQVAAKEVQQVESEGKIGFTGVYEPVGLPNPAPPTNEREQIESTLPQTNTIKSSWITQLGFVLIGMNFVIWKRRQKKTRRK